MESVSVAREGAASGAVKRWAALVVVCTGALLVMLDSTVVYVALPSIRDDLGMSNVQNVWVVNAYMLTYACCLIPGGRLGDLLGARWMFLAGTILFSVASLSCGLAREPQLLVASRAVQGLSGAVVAAVALALIVQMFHDPQARARAMSLYGFVSAAGGSFGVLIGGVVTGTVGWRWLFLINVPVGLAVVVLGFGQLPKARPARREGPPDRGLIPLEAFRNRNFVVGTLVRVLWAGGAYAWFYLCSLYLQRVLGHGPMEVGLAFLPANLLAALVATTSAAVVGRFGLKVPLCIGLSLVAAGVALFAVLPVDAGFLAIIPGMVLIGLGGGLALGPLLLAAMADIRPDVAGLASGVLNTASILGGALGVAVLAGMSVYGFQPAFWIAASTIFSAGLLGLLGLRSGRI